MLLKTRLRRWRAGLAECLARVVLALCILAAACAVFIGAMLSLLRDPAA